MLSEMPNAPHRGRQISAAFWLSQRPTGAIAAACYVFDSLPNLCCKNLKPKSNGNKITAHTVDRNKMAIKIDIPPPSSSRFTTYAVATDRTTHNRVILTGGK